jgi:hypothetical protein
VKAVSRTDRIFGFLPGYLSRYPCRTTTNFQGLQARDKRPRTRDLEQSQRNMDRDRSTDPGIPDRGEEALESMYCPLKVPWRAVHRHSLAKLPWHALFLYRSATNNNSLSPYCSLSFVLGVAQEAHKNILFASLLSVKLCLTGLLSASRSPRLPPTTRSRMPALAIIDFLHPPMTSTPKMLPQAHRQRLRRGGAILYPIILYRRSIRQPILAGVALVPGLLP